MTMRRSQTDITMDRDGEDMPILHFKRQFDHPVERVWRALTEDAELSAWSPWNVQVAPVPGGTITMTFPGAPSGETGTVLEAQPPHLFTFSGHGETLRFQLSSHEGGCLMVLTHTIADPGHTPYTAAGYHICLDQLETLLNEGAAAVQRREMPPPAELVQRYREILRLK